MRTWKERVSTGVMVICLAAVSFSGCGKKAEEAKVQLTRVETQAASTGTLEVTGTYIGTVAPYNSVNVTPLVAGTVQSVNVKVGDKVKAGDILCQFDSKAADLQLQSAEDAVNSAKAGKDAAKDQIRAAKKHKEIYDSANALYIQYQAFLSANPDCATTAGLTAAAMPPIPQAPAANTEDASQGGSEAAAAEPAQEEPQISQGDLEKQQTAAELLEALGEIPLTVEYLTEAGLNTLKDQMEQAETASSTAASGYGSASSSITQLESAIAQLDAQIDALKDNIDAAEDAADAAGGTGAYDAQIKAAQTGVESAQYQKDLYTVTAPIDGVIESVNVKENEASAQGYPAFTISDKEAMEVSFYVPEDVRDYLKAGDEVQVETSAGNVKGRVSSIGTAVDAQKGLFKIVAQITTVTDKSLLSNTSVSLSLVTNSVKNQILIPFDAVYYDNDQAYVFVAQKDTDGEKAVRRDVTTGLYNNDRIVILEGLSSGEEVITTWGAGLKDGAFIEVIQAKDTQTDTQTDAEDKKD